ncbi:ligand-binding sensor domain-containing protein [Paraflavitalea speifideaquila]|uniref:ligand-binding sensor domain-containing protein n=1 Tax=Paraflavitalea speifideaquila TaxID=3076558 RepID=UPI0028E4708E|nr:two-component regulator propeller domain-containing protein [Paraflavitalea speifideiaquila]
MFKWYSILKSYLLYLFITGPIPVTFSQSALRFSHYTTENGLSQGTIYNMLQDSRGFMWFGSWDGLNRFDGYHFRVYKPDPNDTTTLAGGNIQGIVEDKQGHLWIGTDESLNRYDPSINQFRRFFVSRQGKLLTGFYNCFYVDDQNLLWIIVNKTYLFTFDPASGLFTEKPFVHGNMFSFASTNNGIHPFRPVEKVYICGQAGLCLANIKTQTVHNLFSSSNKRGMNISEVYPQNDSTIWLVADTGLIEYHTFQYRFKVYNNHNSVKSLVSIYPDHKGNFWLGSDGFGLYVFDSRKKQFTGQYLKNPINKESIAENIVTTVYVDRDENIWMNVDPTGIDKINTNLQQFNMLKFDFRSASYAYSNSAYGITKLDSHSILVSFNQSGLMRYCPATGEKKMTYLPEYEKVVSANTLFTDDAGGIWTGSDYGIFFSSDKATTFKHFLKNRDLDFYNMYVFCQSGPGQVLLGHSEGVWIIRYKNGQPYLQLSNFTRQGVAAIHKMPGKLFVMATTGGEIIVFDVAGIEIKVLKAIPFSTRVNSIFAINDTVIWLATVKGLAKLDITSQVITWFTEQQGLPSNYIYAAIKGRDDNLWLSSNNGISRFNIYTHRITNYTTAYGIPTKEFNTNAYYTSENGWLFLEARMGFVF